MDKRRVYPASGARIGRHVVVVGRSFAFRVLSGVHTTHSSSSPFFAATEMAAGFHGRPPKRAPRVILLVTIRPIPAVGPAYLLYRGGNVTEKSQIFFSTLQLTVRLFFWHYGALYLFSSS